MPPIGLRLTPHACPAVSCVCSPHQIFIIFYSAYGHTKTMAEKIKAGVDAAGGEEEEAGGRMKGPTGMRVRRRRMTVVLVWWWLVGEGLLYQVAETLPADVVEKMHAPPKPWPEVRPSLSQGLPACLSPSLAR